MNQVIERPLEEAQTIYDEICQKRRGLGKQTKLRQEALDEIPKYAEITKEMKLKRLSRKDIAANYDEKNPAHHERIDSLNDEIDALEAKLAGIALEHYKKTGKLLEVIKTKRNGNREKVRFGFSLHQLSLF